jgi:hypothetical protein
VLLPGYPLYSMLAIAFHALPIGGSPAWRVNLLSTVLAASCALLHFLTIVRWDYWLAFDPSPAGAAARRLRIRRAGRWLPWAWSESVCGAVAGTGLLAFCPLLWSYSTQAEVRADRRRRRSGHGARRKRGPPQPRRSAGNGQRRRAGQR